MSAKLIFVVVAAAAAIGSALAAGLIAAVICLSAKMPAATLLTITAEAAAAASGGVIALSGIAAALFFKDPASAGPDPAGPRAPRDGGDGSTLSSADQAGLGAACDSELRAAVRARSIIVEGSQADSQRLPRGRGEEYHSELWELA